MRPSDGTRGPAVAHVSQPAAPTASLEWTGSIICCGGIRSCRAGVSLCMGLALLIDKSDVLLDRPMAVIFGR